MRLVIDVGNTETVIGWFDSPGKGPRDPARTWRWSTGTRRTPDELRLLVLQVLRDGGVDPSGVEEAVVASVVPSVTEALEPCLGQIASGAVRVIHPATPLPIRLRVDEPLSVGADRIVNTLAASLLYGRDTVVVDLGTATTYDCISADGDFLGGVIAPGLQAGQDWLGGRTAKLPRVEFGPPASVVGRRTESCLQSGIFWSVVDAVEGIVRRIVEEWARPEPPLVVATGGHAGMVAAHAESIRKVEPDLTLIGLDLAGQHLAGS
ncbi:MAG: type III pantothenate kinase [Gemmatimonadales bacterium]|nr:MAG: type III pantothenate kinase [Gemmatimonadales bacterium]